MPTTEDLWVPEDTQGWNPLRPIVSCVNSSTYRLAKHITQLISPLAGATDLFVKNSMHFVEIMAGVGMNPNGLLMSFDVSSLSRIPPYIKQWM